MEIKMEKNKMFRKNVNLIIILLAFVLSLGFISSANIGVSPAKVSFEDVLRGGYAERIVTISSDSEEGSGIFVESRGEISEWINFSKESFEVSKGNSYPLGIVIEPPEDVPNGNYSGFVRVSVSSKGEIQEGQATGVVKSALDLHINVEVTDVEHIECKASDFKVESAEEGDPLVFSLDVLNRGNVRLSPELKVDVWDENQIEVIYSESFYGDFVTPTTQEEILFEVDSDEFDLGQYWVDVSAIECGVSQTLTFDVLEEGALKAQGTLSKIVTPTWINEGETTSIDVFFKNTGDKNVEAQFRGEILSGGKIVQILEGEKRTISIDSEDQFKFYFTPKNPGKYIVSGRVFYDGKRTYEKSAVINARPSGMSFKKILNGSVYVVLLVFISFMIYKIRKQKKSYLKKFGGLGK